MKIVCFWYFCSYSEIFFLSLKQNSFWTLICYVKGVQLHYSLIEAAFCFCPEQVTCCCLRHHEMEIGICNVVKMKNDFLIWITKRKLVYLSNSPPRNSLPHLSPKNETNEYGNATPARQNDPSKLERCGASSPHNIPGLSISLMVSKQCIVIGIHCKDWHIGGRKEWTNIKTHQLSFEHSIDMKTEYPVPISSLMNCFGHLSDPLLFETVACI